MRIPEGLTVEELLELFDMIYISQGSGVRFTPINCRCMIVPRKLNWRERVMNKIQKILPILIMIIMVYNVQAEVEIIGNPMLYRYSEPATISNRIKRVSWDMYAYNGKIYVGTGDYIGGASYVPIISFDINGNFIREFNTIEEELHIFREYADILYTPGIDPHGAVYKGTLYKRGKNVGWKQLQTIPRAYHLFDIAFDASTIYITMSGANRSSAVLKSVDGGKIWSGIDGLTDTDASYYREAIVNNGVLYVFGADQNSKPCIYRYDTTVDKMLVDYRWGTGQAITHSKVDIWNDELVYMVNLGGVASLANPKLVVLKKFGDQPQLVDYFKDKSVRDMFIRNGVCYVLTSTEVGTAHIAVISASTDLIKWTGLLQFTLLDKPYSFEMIDGTWFVGVGYRTEHSGSIYKVGEATFPIEPSEAPATRKVFFILKEGVTQEHAMAEVGEVWFDIDDNVLRVGQRKEAK